MLIICPQWTMLLIFLFFKNKETEDKKESVKEKTRVIDYFLFCLGKYAACGFQVRLQRKQMQYIIQVKKIL